ncbi:MAG TPA: sulfite exporter TauE/SafE family protein [Verrucomicrobiae bacterium]|nr:sulfite exporter TauE/SafE family protein [Verrucomicrobiae bacterium]
MIALLSGLAAGAVHVISGPDHLAAIAPLAVANWRKALAIGFRWGLGHSSGVLFVGLLALVTRELLPLEALSGWAERFVGVLLIGIGLWGLRRATKSRLHAHEHTHDGTTHLHYHAHGNAHTASQKTAHQHTHTAFMVGTVHGIAGGSHFLGVVPALLLTSRIESMLYLAAFALGTVLGMIAFAGALGFASQKLQHQPARYRLIASTASMMAILLGFYWIAG